MGKKKKKHDKIALVQSADEMDDGTLLNHLEVRHAHDTGVPRFQRENVIREWIGPYRAFHERVHSIAVYPYDHIHEE
jgi:hypothetical protein